MIPSARINSSVDDRIFFTSLGSTSRQFYYQNNHKNKIRFLNVPKNASTFIRNYFQFLRNPSPEPLSFCIIREPRDRFFSVYKYAVNVLESFDKFVMVLQKNKNINDHNLIRVGVEHLLPQSFFVDNAPVEWRRGCKLITFEDFFADTPSVSLRAMGIQTIMELPLGKVNATQDFSQSYYDVINDKIDNQYREFFYDYFSQDYGIYELAKSREVLS